MCRSAAICPKRSPPKLHGRNGIPTRLCGVNRLRRDIFDEDADGACFEVVARTAGGEAVGRLHCIRNRQDPTLWYYGDLFVVPAYRRERNRPADA